MAARAQGGTWSGARPGSAARDTTRGTPAPAPRATPWYERLSLRGYTQIRYNQLYRSNPQLACAQCDRTLGGTGGFSLRRSRLVLSGNVNDRVWIYLQPDFAADVGGTLFVGQIRDAYADVFLDRTRRFRLRLGQSKMPYGFENMQSSSNRLPLDRADALNSAMVNERDIGAVFYWTPPQVRRRLAALVDSGLKGSGDFGMVGLGVFNGQGAARPEANNSLHTVARIAYPFQLASGQYVELGVMGYTGRYVLPSNLRSAGLSALPEYRDERVGGTFVWYPQPLGLVAEWNVGRGPEAVPEQRATRERRLEGGYVQTMYRLRPAGQVVIPFVRAQRYDGGKKFELDARRYRVRELEAGVEWLPTRAFELVAQFGWSDRRYEDLALPVNRQRGRTLRLQAQINY